MTSNKEGDERCFGFGCSCVSTRLFMTVVSVTAVSFFTSVPTEYFKTVVDWELLLC